MLERYRRTVFTAEGKSRDVWVAGEGPPVLVLHEVPGLHPGVIAFGDRLVAAGFQVWMPSMFGEPERPFSLPYSVRSIVRNCLSREFVCLGLRRASPLTDWLRALARHAHDLTGRPVGAVGMCFTGGFALALAVDEHLRAPVLSQPSLPFAVSPAHARDLGIGDDALRTLRRRCADDGLCVLGLRFSHDAMSPAARFDRLRQELGEGFLAVEIDSGPANAHAIPRLAHSVLTLDLVDEPGHPTLLALERTVAFLRERLHRGG